MKIGFVLDDGLDKPDGVQQYILTIGNWLESKGHEVRYLVGETTRTDIPNVYSLPKNIKVKFNGNSLTIPLAASKKKIKKVLEEEKFDVLHIQVPYHPLFGAKVVSCSDPSTAVIGTFHILPYGWLSKVGTRLLGIVLRHNLKRFDRMVSVSKPAAKFAHDTFKIESEVVPNSVNTAKFRPAKSFNHLSGNKLLFLGRLVERKGAMQLLEAILILKKLSTLPEDVTLDICGDGNLRTKLEDFVNEHGLSEIVKFHGFITEKQKVEFMNNADFAIFPSLSGESFGIVLIEAMAAESGVVLGGNNPGYMSVLHDVPESIVDAHNTDIFAHQLLKLLNDKESQVMLHEKQQLLVKQFDTEVVGNTLLKIYESCKTKRSNR